MPANEWYKNWFNSPFYHKLYFERDETEAKEFIENLIRHLNPPPMSRMLDVGCGKGRHSRILANAGFNVTGIDIAPESVQFAKQFEQENLNFYIHDMRLPFWVNYFDIAFNFFTSFGYFTTRREHDDAMRTIVNAIKKSGYVVFDYLNVHYAENNLVHNEEKVIENTNYEIHRWHDDNHFYKKIIITDPQLSSPLEYTEKVAKLTLGEFTDMLSFQKMQVTEVFGDYKLSSYDIQKTPRLILIAKKMD